MAAEHAGAGRVDRGARRFEGRRVLVTGGSSGIGRATVLAFAAAGARVVAAARRSDRLAEVQRDAPAGAVQPLNVDISSPGDARRMVADAIDMLGGLDVLVNNAGVAYSEPFLDATEERWSATLDTNLSGSFFASQAAAR